MMGYRANNLGSYLLLEPAIWREAERYLSDALAHRLGAPLAPDHPNVVNTADWLATCHLMRGMSEGDLGVRTEKVVALANAHPFSAGEARRRDAKRFLDQIEARGWADG